MPAGPVDVVIVEFPETPVGGELVDVLADLVSAETIRILDLVIVAKDSSGHLQAVEIDDLDGELETQFAALDGEYDGLVSDSDIEQVGAGLAPGSTAVLVAWENLWLGQMAEDLRAAGGHVVAHERIPGPIVEAALAELTEIAQLKSQNSE
jgi:uncharacterized membrane protein